MKLIVILLSLTIFFLSCRKCEELPLSCGNNQGNISQNQMNLYQLKAGQKFRYILFTANGYYHPDSTNFIYTGDTLELEILEAGNNNYLISEKITPGSNMMTSKDQYYWDSKDSVYSNKWIIRNDSLVFEYQSDYFRSHLIFTYENRYSLAEFNSSEVQIIGWKTSFPYTERDVKLYTKDYSLLGNCYKRLNIYIDNSFMQVDGPGNTTIYSKEYGIVRTSTYSWWTGEGIGWDKL